MANKTVMIVAVIAVVAVCAAGAVVLLNNSGEKDSDYTPISVMGSTTVEPLMMSFQEAYEKQAKVSISISAQGSGTAAPAIRSGIADIGMLSRDRNASESDMTPLIIAGDGVVIIVDKNANVSNLTLEQVSKIYRGDFTNWSQVGGADLTIRPIIREDASGTRECLDAAMAANLGISVATLAEKYTSYPMRQSTGEMLTQTNSVAGGIGYVNLGALSNLGANVVAVSIGGVAPSPAAVTNLTYEISRNLLLITGGTPTGEVKAFLDWIMSPAGQDLVEKAGFVPVGPTA